MSFVARTMTISSMKLCCTLCKQEWLVKDAIRQTPQGGSWATWKSLLSSSNRPWPGALPDAYRHHTWRCLSTTYCRVVEHHLVNIKQGRKNSSSKVRLYSNWALASRAQEVIIIGLESVAGCS
jgi:hypothetical protein